VMTKRDITDSAITLFFFHDLYSTSFTKAFFYSASFTFIRGFTLLY